ncbi:MAG: hypothetical protein M3Q14_03000 [bacterium]|nr:hypothetical protein [bacterium]
MKSGEELSNHKAAIEAGRYFLIQEVLQGRPPELQEVVAHVTGEVGLSPQEVRQRTRSYSLELGNIMPRAKNPFEQAKALGIEVEFIEALQERIRRIESDED